MSKGTALIKAVEKGSQVIKAEDAPRVAQRINTQFGTRAPGTKEGVATAVRQIVRDNPGKAAIVATALAGLGIAEFTNLGSTVEDFLFSSDYNDKLDGGAIRESYLEAKRVIDNQLAGIVGDGKRDSVLGQSADDFNKDVGQLQQQFALIQTGIAAFGSLASFERVREALFGVEPEAINAYRALRPNY